MRPAGIWDPCPPSLAGAGRWGPVFVVLEQRGQEAREETCSWYRNFDHRLSWQLLFSIIEAASSLVEEC